MCKLLIRVGVHPNQVLNYASALPLPGQETAMRFPAGQRVVLRSVTTAATALNNDE